MTHLPHLSMEAPCSALYLAPTEGWRLHQAFKDKDKGRSWHLPFPEACQRAQSRRAATALGGRAARVTFDINAKDAVLHVRHRHLQLLVGGKSDQVPVFI